MSLYRFERDGDVQELIRVLEESDAERIRGRAAELLGTFDDHADRDAAIDALVDAAQANGDRVPAIAVDALSNLGADAIERLLAAVSDRPLEEATAAQRVEAYVEILDDAEPEFRMAAANALGRLGDTETTSALIAALDDPDPRVRERVARACGELGDPRATDALADRLADGAASVRRAAADALGRLGTREALEALLELYEDDDRRVRRIAVGAFGNFENDRPVEQLVAALDDDSPTVQRTAVYSTVELLSGVPADRSHEIRETVVETAAARDDPIVIDPLIEIVESGTQPAQRRNATWLLGRVTDSARRRRVIDALVEALDADDELIRQFAATSLEELGGEDVAGRLLDLVTDEGADPRARAQAIFVLGKVGDERALRALETVIDETADETIRDRAVTAASKLGGEH